MKILVVIAHPDEVELYAGGTVTALARAGHAVKVVSLTNGDAGHHAMDGVSLARRRAMEAVRAGEHMGVMEYDVWDAHDGELEPSVALRRRVIETIRGWRTDLVIAMHDDCPGHVDNRAAGRVVRDAVAFTRLPNVVPDKPHLDRLPMCLLMTDYAAVPCHKHDVVVDVDAVIDAKLDACAAHASQFFEWSPYERGLALEEDLHGFIRKHWGDFLLTRQDMRPALKQAYGHDRARHAESFQLAPYGRQAGVAEVREALGLGKCS